MKRPLSLTLLLLTAGSLGAFGLLQTFLTLKQLATGAWPNATLAQIATFVMSTLISVAMSAWILWLGFRKKALVRVVGSLYIGVFALAYLYKILFAWQVRGALSSYRLTYEDPAFGFAVERVFSLALVVLLIWWAYKIAFSAGLRAYLSDRADGAINA